MDRHSQGCTKLASVSLPSSMRTIGEGAFSDTALSDVTIPNGVTSIGSVAFYGCTDITSITFPISVTQVSSSAFIYCSRLNSVTVKNPKANISQNAFLNCSSALVIHSWPNSKAQAFAIEYGYAFDSRGEYSGQCGDNVTFALDIPNGTVTFSGTGNMWNYTSWDASLFSEGSWIKTVVINNGVTSVADYLMYACDGLTSVKLASSVTSIGQSAFKFCTGLTGMMLPTSVSSIGNSAFEKCTSLQDITILNQNASIGSNVFSGRSSGLTIHGFTGSTAQSYANSQGITFVSVDEPTFFLPDDLTSIGADAFSNISAKAVVIPKTVTSISGNPFAGSAVVAIYGYPGTAAETLANTYGYIFYPIDDNWMAGH